MSERKVLNKYYPPDFDASKLPRVKRDKNRQFTIRLMAPFNMRCKTCGEYIYRGKKFNARKEDVIGKLHLGIQIYRFYIKCTKCLAEITFLTDPENQDYEMENGAMRNFESIRLAEKQAEVEAKQKKDEEENNPMKILENRTRDSRREMAVLETLEDLRELNAANAGVDPKILITAEEEYSRQLELLQKQEDEEEIKRMFSKEKSDSDFLVPELINQDTKTKRNSEHSTESNLSKKIKVEPNEKPESKLTPTMQLLSKNSNNTSHTQVQTSSTQLTKNNLNSFIKKKADTILSNNSNEKLAPTASSSLNIAEKSTASLQSLMSSYGSDSDNDD